MKYDQDVDYIEFRVNNKNHTLDYENAYCYLLENIVNHKYIVVNAYLIDSELYLKEVKDEDVLRKLSF